MAEAVHVPGHLAAPGSPKAKQLIHAQAHSCSTLTGAELPQAKKGGGAKKSLVFMHAGWLPSCLTLCHPVDCGLPGFSVREGVLQARILERISQYWLPYPSGALYFLLP